VKKLGSLEMNYVESDYSHEAVYATKRGLAEIFASDNQKAKDRHEALITSMQEATASGNGQEPRKADKECT
jgi:hypothetical protein